MTRMLARRDVDEGSARDGRCGAGNAQDEAVVERFVKQPDGNNVLVMNLSKECAENNGMACLSAPIKIEPNTRYRLSFRYQSDGPKLRLAPFEGVSELGTFKPLSGSSGYS